MKETVMIVNILDSDKCSNME